MRIVLGSELQERLLRLMGIEFVRSRLGLQDLDFREFEIIYRVLRKEQTLKLGLLWRE